MSLSKAPVQVSNIIISRILANLRKCYGLKGLSSGTFECRSSRQLPTPRAPAPQSKTPRPAAWLGDEKNLPPVVVKM